MQYCLSQGSQWDPGTCAATAAQGHLHLLVYLHEQGCPWEVCTCISAAKYGHLNCLRYVHEQGCPWGRSVCAAAVLFRQHLCLGYALQHGCPVQQSAAVTWACKLGSVECLRLLSAHGCVISYEAAGSAMRATSFDDALQCIEHCINHGHAGNSELCTAAVEFLPPGDRQAMLNFLIKHGRCPLTPQASASAARLGDMDCLIFLHQHDCIWEEDTCAEAALAGNLECLRYAHKHGCPWDEGTCEGGARSGQLDCLRYALEKGCPCSEDTAVAVIEARTLRYGEVIACLDLLLSHGVELGVSISNAAARSGRLDYLQWLWERKCLWDASTCTAAAKSRRLDCLQWLHEHGCPWDETAFSLWTYPSGLCIMKYLLENKCPCSAAMVAWQRSKGFR